MTAFDASSYHNDGLLTNGPARMPGGAVSFDGIDDFVEVPHAESLAFDTAITVTVRVNITDYMTNWPKLAVHPHSAYAEPWEMFALDLGHYGASPRFLITDGQPGGQLTVASDGGVTLDRNRWYDIAGTYDGSAVSLYVDGQRVASAPASFAIGQNTMPLSIGSRQGINSFCGLIDEVRVYNRCLGGAEIQALHESGQQAAEPGP